MSSRRSVRLSIKSEATNGKSQESVNNGTGAEKNIKSKPKAARKIKEERIVTEIGESPATMTPPKATRGKGRGKSSTKAEEDDTPSINTSTPKRKTQPANDAQTPTPKKRRTRPADPHATNVPLQTPGGSRVLKTYPTELCEPAPTTSGAATATTTTTDNLLERACAHLLSVDPGLAKVMDANPCAVFSPAGLQEPVNPFASLCSTIIGQQVSGAAAAAIKKRFVALFAGGADAPFPTPAQVLAADAATLRSAGLSQRKAEYIAGLADKFVSGELSAQMLLGASDEELVERLTAVRGLGRWSVEMFACFTLKRMDIFALGDLGVQRGVAVYRGKDVGRLRAAKGGGKWKYCSEKDMLDTAAPFVPYRSLFMYYMWRIEDVNLDVMKN